jgi:hypothetical protein
MSTIATGLPRITGFTLDSGTSGRGCSQGLLTGLIHVSGNNPGFRVDHNRFINTRCTAIAVHTYARGVIDNNYFELVSAFFIASIWHGTWGNVTSCQNQPYGCGDKSWAEAAQWGTKEFVFFEDNIFTSTGAIYFTDGWRGQRVVYRRNTLTDATLQNHGADSVGRTRSGRAVEAYQNTITNNRAQIRAAIGVRGGSAMIWGNILSANWGRIADATHYRLTTTNPKCAGGSCSFCAWWNCCDSPGAPTIKGTNPPVGGNAFDQGAGTTNGYACMDQVGRGQGTLITGDEPPGKAISPVGWPSQVREPLYGWYNLLNGANTLITPHVSTASYVLDDREFYNMKQTPVGGVQAFGTMAPRPRLTARPGSGRGRSPTVPRRAPLVIPHRHSRALRGGPRTRASGTARTQDWMGNSTSAPPRIPGRCTTRLTPIRIPSDKGISVQTQQ